MDGLLHYKDIELVYKWMCTLFNIYKRGKAKRNCHPPIDHFLSDVKLMMANTRLAFSLLHGQDGLSMW